jgi:hypothetical protein
MNRLVLFALASCAAVLVSTVPATSTHDSQLEQAIDAIPVQESDWSLDDPEHIMAWITLPRVAGKGDLVTLVVTIENGRVDRDFRLSSVEIWEEFLKGFAVVSISPEPRHQDGSPGSLRLEYPVDLAPGETWDLEVILRAERTGVFVGDVDVDEGDRFLTRAAQIRVE